MVKNPPANAGDAGLIPGSGRSPGGGNGNHSSILAWEIPWTEEPGGLQSVGSQGVEHDLATKQQKQIIYLDVYWMVEMKLKSLHHTVSSRSVNFRG